MTAFKPITKARQVERGAANNSSSKESIVASLAKQVSYTNYPVVDAKFHQAMPWLLQQGTEAFLTEREKDSFLLAALGVLSGCMPTVQGVYDGMQVGPNLYVFVIAPAGSGKGSLVWAWRLVLGYHLHVCALSNELRQVFDQRQAEARQNKEPFTEPAPPYKTLFLPGNSSSTAFLKSLKENDQQGVIFETEADTLSGALKQDWGDYSDVLRKGFYHEPISYLRKSGERYELNRPAISVVLSGTPGQVKKLIPDAENGLFSRFLFYTYQTDAVWRDVSPQSGRPILNEHFADLVEYTTQMILNLKAFGEIRVELTPVQWDNFNQAMGLRLTRALMLRPESSSSSVYGMGLIVYRIAMILTVLRRYQEGTITQTLTCSDTDFGIALDLSSVLLEHALLMTAAMPQAEGASGSSKQRQFYDQLPKKFSRMQADQIATLIGIKTRSVTNYLAQLTQIGRLTKVEHGMYEKA